MYVPPNRNGEDGKMLVSQAQLLEFMEKSIHQTNVNRLPSGGILFTSFTPNRDRIESAQLKANENKRSGDITLNQGDEKEMNQLKKMQAISKDLMKEVLNNTEVFK